uniref:ANK_REP_REGION domain-containing protein n=1 Tax=Trichobilharzia regenti TaxID=157069 RepID=A0AA85JFZ0_TRIRE|nr:unnamed protein product [Trichobilharzia regenti]
MHDMDSVQFECQQFRSANPTMVTDMSRNPKILRTRVFTSTKFLVVNKKFNSQLYHNRTLDIIFTMSPVTTEDTNNGMEEQVVVSKNYINNKLLLQQGIIEVNTMDSAGLQMNLEDNTRIHEINIPRIFLTQNLNPFEWSQVLSNCMNISPEIIKQAWFQMISSKSVNSRLIDLCINSLKQISVNLVDEIVNIADKRGNTALHYAISQANWPIVYTLMNNSTKTDVNKFNRAGYTPLMMAAMWISKPITKEDTATLDMVVSRANLKLISQNDFKRTVLILAAIYGCETIVSSVLTKRKSLINQSDAGGSTAIMCAAEHNHLNVVTVLLGQSKINLQLKDINGRTALEIAIAKQNYLIALLIYAKIQVQRLNTSYYRFA